MVSSSNFSLNLSNELISTHLCAPTIISRYHSFTSAIVSFDQPVQDPNNLILAPSHTSYLETQYAAQCTIETRTPPISTGTSTRLSERLGTIPLACAATGHQTQARPKTPSARPRNPARYLRKNLTTSSTKSNATPPLPAPSFPARTTAADQSGSPSPCCGAGRSGGARQP